MRENDIILVQEIARESWYATYEGIIPKMIQDRFLQTAYSKERLTMRLHNSPFLVAILDERLVGFANFSNSIDGKVELFAIYLLPNYQQRGIGTTLLQHGIQECKGATSLIVCVEKDNEIGMRFYKDKGFKIIEEFNELFLDHTLKSVRLELKLAR